MTARLNTGVSWTDAQEAQLRTMWQARVDSEAARDFDLRAGQVFGRSTDAIRTKRNKMHMYAPRDVGQYEPPIFDDRAQFRRAAECSNTLFLAALAKVKSAPEPPVKAEQRFTMLPPPALIGGASC